MIFGFFKAKKETKAVHTCLMQFLHTIEYTETNLGSEVAASTVKAEAITKDVREQIVGDRRIVTFGFIPPASEFRGSLEIEKTGEIGIQMEGAGSFCGITIQKFGFDNQVRVFVLDGVRSKATNKAMWLHARFVSFGAKDTTKDMMKYG